VRSVEPHEVALWQKLAEREIAKTSILPVTARAGQERSWPFTPPTQQILADLRISKSQSSIGRSLPLSPMTHDLMFRVIAATMVIIVIRRNSFLPCQTTMASDRYDVFRQVTKN
jgi:hypothetical protein